LSQVKDIWFNTWNSVGDRARKKMTSVGDPKLAKIYAFHAASYYQLALRYTSMFEYKYFSIYNTSRFLFMRNIKGICEEVQIPYPNWDRAILGYWCPAVNPTTKQPPTILAFTGYDGSSEGTYYSVGAQVTSAGFNVLVFDGPGQGDTVRYEHSMTFQPDWEKVVDAVYSYVTKTYNGVVDPTKVILWGRSFGGYLAPRAFSKLPYLYALVADGAIYDFFQSLVCSVPEKIRELLWTDVNTFSTYLEMGRKYSLSLDFMLTFGQLGFGTKTAGELFTAFEPYHLTPEDMLTLKRPIFVNAPSLDTLTQNQSQIFYNNLPSDMSPHTRFFFSACRRWE